MNATTTAPTLDPPPIVAPTAALLNADESAALLGISTAHLYNLHARGKLGPEPVRMGRAVRWHRDELLAWTKAKCPDRFAWKIRRSATTGR